MAHFREAPVVAGHKIVEFSRPAHDVGIAEQLRRGDVRPYNFSEPGSHAEARCACGWRLEGEVTYVATMAREHEAS